MRTVGIDIGSRTIKLAILDGARFTETRVTDTTYNPIHVCQRILEGLNYDRLGCTGYGRHLFKEHWSDAVVITEIKAASLGAFAAHPSTRTIIDIGGQDTKAIAIDHMGNMIKFSMNDRCAAGTGRFLEMMATVLSYTSEEFENAALRAKTPQILSSMCTVFAESEVVSLVTQGAKREEIALGIHNSIINRTGSLLGGITVSDDVLFIGGGALNKCLHPLFENKLKKNVHIPEDPQVIAAKGCALHLTKV